MVSEIPCAVKDNGESCSTCFEKISFSSIKNRISDKKGSYSYQYIIN